MPPIVSKCFKEFVSDGNCTLTLKNTISCEGQ